MEEQCSEERFLKDVSQHKLTVVHATDNMRRLQFRRGNGDSSYWFDLVTWPGALCISGDMGTYVFRRLPDMFEFFRADAKSQDETLYINPSYWGEKMTAVATNGGYEEFSEDKFRAAVKERFDSYVSDELADEADARKESVTPEEEAAFQEKAQKRAELWEAIESDALSYIGDDRNGARAQQAVNDFEHEGFEFLDFWEINTNQYTFSFIWCLYAIAWGIEQFDAATAVAA